MKISEDGRGVSTIADMLKLTRIHNAVSSAAGMRRSVNASELCDKILGNKCFPFNVRNVTVSVDCRMLMLSRDFSTKREAFGKLIKDHALHVKTLADMEVRN